MKYNNEIFKDDVYEYFSKDVELIKKIKPHRYGHLPEIPDINLLAMVKYLSNGAEGLLIEYYKGWNKKSTEYINDYKKGEKEILGIKDKLQEPFKGCHRNCIKVLKALDLINSSFFDSTKYKSHAKYLCKYDRKDLRLCYDKNDELRYKNPVDTIYVLDSYETIGSIDLEKNVQFNKIIWGYRGLCSWWRLSLLV